MKFSAPHHKMNEPVETKINFEIKILNIYRSESF